MTPPRRLLVVLHGAQFGGVERQAELVAAAARRAGHHLSLVITGNEGPALARFRPHCHSIDVLGADISNDLAVWRALRRAARAGHDVAFVFNLAKFPVLSNALRRSVPRQVLHVGNPVGTTPAERWKQQARSWLFPPSPALRLAANSQHTLRSLQVHPFYGRFPSRVSLDCVSVPGQPVPLRQRCEPIRFGMVARLDAIKDHATLIRATGLLARRGLSVQCELVGRGDTEAALRRLAEQEGLLATGQVTFTGWLDDVGEALARWDLFVFSTTAREGFGNAAAEAMAHGLPCLFSDVGPCREVGADAVGYVPPGDAPALADAIAALADSIERRQALGQAARARAQACFEPRSQLDDFLASAFT